MLLFSSFLPFVAHADDANCGKIIKQNSACAILEKNGSYILLEWTGKGFFYDGHTLCGDTIVSGTNSSPYITLEDKDTFDRAMNETRVRVRKTASNADALQNDFIACSKE